MSIVLPIVFLAVGVGLFAHRITPRVWALLTVWIMLVIALNYFKA